MLRNDGFKGSLFGLFEEGFKLGPRIDLIDKFDKWLLNQYKADNILPFRKFGRHMRGAIMAEGPLFYVAVDNEPLAWLMAKWGSEANSDFRELFVNKKMPISWNVEAKPDFDHKTGGVETSFREAGYKLAHIEHAGLLNLQTPYSNAEELRERSLRSLLFSNVFLFPSSKIFKFEFTDLPANRKVNLQQPEEDPFIRALAKSWLESKLLSHDSAWTSRLTNELRTVDNWRDILERVKINVAPKKYQDDSSPKKMVKQSQQVEDKKIPTKSPEIDGKCHPCVKKSAHDNLQIADAILILKAWRAKNPDASRLDCGPPPKSNASAWLCFHVSGYQDGIDDFVTKHTNVKIKGSKYNGCVHFNGDAKASAIDEFIAAYEACDGDYKSILRPSATYEGNKRVPKSGQKQKFSLIGFKRVSGFYLYHGC